MTYRRVRESFEFEGPQMVNVKGKGELAVYRLIGPAGRATATAAPAGDK
jgi:hypothetical protein